MCKVIIFGLFKDLKSKQAKTFKKVAKKYNDGFKFGQSSDPKVWSRFDDIVDTEKEAEVLILRNFRENGEVSFIFLSIACNCLSQFWKRYANGREWFDAVCAKLTE